MTLLKGLLTSFTLVVSLSLVSCRSQIPLRSVEDAMPVANGPVSTVFAKASGSTSLVYMKRGDQVRRFSVAKAGWESDPVLSRDGQLVAYASGDTEKSRSTIWVAHIDGSHAHPVSPADQDALMPAFAADTKSVLYVISRNFGHASPVAASRRHDFDVMRVAIDPNMGITSAVPNELTQSYFRDVQSLSVSPDGEQFLLSTSSYPIGSLLQEFRLDYPLRQHRVFQPHISGEPSTGSSFGPARYVGDGTTIVFLAASEPADGGDFDYNVYSVSEVTGAKVTRLTQHKGMIDSLSIGTGNDIGFTDAAGYSPVGAISNRP